MFDDIKAAAHRAAPTLGQDMAGAAALILMLIVGLNITAWI